MRFKILFIVGLGVGYVLGARAGRPSYERLKARATDAWEDPRVQKVVAETQEFVKENAPIVQDKVVAGTKAAVASAQDAAARASVVARDVSDKVTETTKDVSKKVAKSSRQATKRAKEASKKVAKAAQNASDNVTRTAKVVRDRIADRSEDVVDGVIIAAGKARDEALDIETDDDEK